MPKILKETLHATHLLKVIDKMYRYEMDPTRTVGATERTQDAGQTDGRTGWNQYTLQQLRCAQGIIRRSRDRLNFNMGIPILVRLYFYIEMGPRFFRNNSQGRRHHPVSWSFWSPCKKKKDFFVLLVCFCFRIQICINDPWWSVKSRTVRRIVVSMPHIYVVHIQ